MSLNNAGQPSKLIVYSNKPPIVLDKATKQWVPNLSGGAVRVILGSPVKVWIGPLAPEKIPDGMSEEDYAKQVDSWYANLADEEKFPTKPVHVKQEGKEFDIYAFPVPYSVYKAQYEEIANRLFWPIHHSQDPDTIKNPLLAMNRIVTPETFIYPTDLVTAQNDFDQYKRFNEIANAYLKRLEKQGVFSASDRLWVHDYQCANVGVMETCDDKGEPFYESAYENKVFSFHIPFPPLSYLQKVRIHAKPESERQDGEDDLVPILQTPFFKDYMRIIATNKLVTFQRPVDQQNFFEALAYLDRDVWADNDLIFRGNVLDGNVRNLNPAETVFPQPLGTTSLSGVQALGKKFATMNLPVGTSQEENLQKAKANEESLTTTKFNEERLKLTGIELPKWINGRPRDPKEPVTIETLMGDILRDTGEPHQVFFSAHRNDYTKCTWEKLTAAQAFLEENPQAVGKVHFVFFLEPTRGGIIEYKKYEENVLEYANNLHGRFGDSVLVVPQGISQGEVMGILRQPNVVALLGLGMKDGHDLTLREAADAQSDRKDAKLAIVTTSGTGASDVLDGAIHGAFVINRMDDRKEFIADIKDTCKQIYDKNLSGNLKGHKDLEKRYRRMAEVSGHYSGLLFGDSVSEALDVISGTKPNLPLDKPKEPAGYGARARRTPLRGDEKTALDPAKPENLVTMAQVRERVQQIGLPLPGFPS